VNRARNPAAPAARLGRRIARAALFACAVAVAAAHAAPPRPVAKDHPIVGQWTFTTPDSGCAETYLFRTDGTAVVTSAAEIAETAFEISATPSGKGFYKWTDRIVKDNGKKDCAGQVTPVGKENVNYIMFNPPRDRFVVCARESLDRCFGPFVRARGLDL
jgi:hypothetical protein